MQPSQNKALGASSSVAIEVTAQNFMQEVMQASLQLPVLLYFTASWCGPCKQFGPILEKVVGETKGRIKLAKVDVDKNPQIAQQFRIQSVPMVYILLQGQPLDAFQGAVPESQLKQMVAQLLNATPEGQEVIHSLDEAKKLLQAGQPEAALQHFEALLQADQNNMEALAGAAAALVALGQLDEAEALVKAVPEASQNMEAVQSVKAALKLARNAPSRDALTQLSAKLAKDANDHASRFELAQALFASSKQEEAITELLHIVAKDKSWNENAARTKLLEFFEALGHTHPLTMQGRRKLSSLIF